MANMFSRIIRSILGNKSSDDVIAKNQASDDAEGKHYLDFDLIEKKEFIHLESAYQNQEYVFRRATESNRLVLGEILGQVFNVEESSVLSMAIAYRLGDFGNDITEKIVEAPNEIWNFDMFSCILKNKTDEGHYTKGMFHETTLIVRTKIRNCIFILSSLGGPDTVKYMRVSLLSPDNSLDDDGASLRTHNAPTLLSFILSYSETENNSDFQTYFAVEKSVMEKHQQGLELTELEQEYVHGQFEFQGYYYIGYGKWLFDQNRYYDTFSILERGFNYMNSQLDWNDSNKMSAFYDICTIMGVCLSKMDREDEASYYFKQGASGLSLNEANTLALSYAKLGNPVAMKQMTDWLMLVAQKYGDHENWSEEVKRFSVDVPVELSRYKKVFDENLELSPSYEEGITIGYVLRTLWGLNKKNLSSCMFIYDTSNNKFQERIDDIDLIFDYSLDGETSVNKVFVLSCSHVHYKINDDEDKSILCHNAPIVISTHSIIGKESTSSIRVDMIRQNFSNNDDKRDFARVNTPLGISFTIGVPYGLSYTSDKDSLLNAIRKAIDLVDEKRFVEALKLSKWVFECTSNSLKDKMGIKYESQDELLWDIFFEASYTVGFCLMELGKAHTAAYYLEIASHSMNYKHIQEYINCLANSQDPQALEVVEDVIQRSPKPDSKESIMSWSNHMAFLKRRKAYVLIDRKRYVEARSLLSEMLNDPMCKDFAQDELNYLNAIERNER